MLRRVGVHRPVSRDVCSPRTAARQTFPGDLPGISDMPLISSLAPMLTLRAEYENGSQFFVKQIDWLIAQGWHGVRRTRGDGEHPLLPPRHASVLMISARSRATGRASRLPGDCFYRCKYRAEISTGTRIAELGAICAQPWPSRTSRTS